jgi:osmoprotectant transport system substrate-binding protein
MTPLTKSLGLLATAALLLTACSSGGDAESSASSAAPAAATSAAAEPSAPAEELGSLTIGAFNFTESQIMAELYAGVLSKAGYDVEVIQSTNREVLQPALETGEVQVVPEYLGTFTEFLNFKVNGPDAAPAASNDVAATLAAARALAEPLGITVLEPSPAEDVNAFAISGAFAQESGIASLSDLAAWSAENDLVLGGPPECPERPFCQLGLEEVYGMQVAEFVPLDAGGPLTKSALDQGSINVGLLFSSDGSIVDRGFVVLDDDQGLQNVDNVVPAVLTSAVTEPLTQALDGLSAALTTEDLIAMNKAVDFDREEPQQVAQDFLASKGLQ